MKSSLVLLYGLLLNSIVQTVLSLISPLFWESPFSTVDTLFWALTSVGFLGAIKSTKERAWTQSAIFEYLLAINISCAFLGLGMIGAKFNFLDFANQYNQYSQTSSEGFAISLLGLSTLFAWFTGKVFDA